MTPDEERAWEKDAARKTRIHGLTAYLDSNREVWIRRNGPVIGSTYPTADIDSPDFRLPFLDALLYLED
jgi:hypothetical protein